MVVQSSNYPITISKPSQGRDASQDSSGRALAYVDLLLLLHIKPFRYIEESNHVPFVPAVLPSQEGRCLDNGAHGSARRLRISSRSNRATSSSSTLWSKLLANMA